ncbi:outer membrane lipoprotein-sorting protein, partial [candidate division KSB1 bacterium]|nr:outer membrane lipoprotein-sorting protein [candidate division KSB1 bacterium]NIR69670.1 outer membrane lipoprotein-sorting protein [candidate division KSB1 bacterium]NIS27474.1 outer membrane lipoprotein-sorting protein [candidate division KSB1 bacterium]NIT74328.1 outer membrane lipoprotein-sorting protein [candidate division KSB1 bacterium]NIU28188.1 outer membrane lipoprotein-sorting protein [candidate division KSB1 bacterium]
SRLKVWVLRDNYYPEKIEMYDDPGSLWKVLEQKQIVLQNGYWIAKEMQMTDVKENHSTVSVMSEIELDSGLDDNLFTQRYLMRMR